MRTERSGVNAAFFMRGWAPPVLVFGGGAALLLLLMVVHVMQGAADLTPRMVLEAVFAPQDTAEHQIVRTLRLPRVVAGMLAGGALAVAGVLLQTITRNPLASAGTLGINAGAYFAVVAATVFAPSLMGVSPMLVAFGGAVFAALLAYSLAGGLRATPLRMTLAGMIVSMAVSAMTGALQLLFEEETSGLFLWGSGTLVQNDWSGVSAAWPWVGAAAAAALFLSRSLDLLLLSEETAQSLGQHVGRIRLISLVLALLLAAVIVSIVGPVGFVGLLAPHLVRLIGVRSHKLLLPASFLWGAVILVAADVGSRLANNSSYGELPVGAVTALIGGPCLAYLSYRAAQKHREVPKPSASSLGTTTRFLPYRALLGLFAVLLVAVTILGMIFGDVKVPLQDVLAAVQGQGPELARSIVLDQRLPRMLVAACAGAALAVSGLLLQGVVRNPMADPSIVGVSAGAGVGALLLLLVWPELPIALLPFASFAGAIAAALIVYLIARKTGLQPAVLALVGIAVSACGSAVIQLIVVQTKMNVAVALAWISGSTYARGWEELAQLVVWPVLLLPLAWLIGRRVDILAFGQEGAVGLGVNVEQTRLRAAAIGVALAAAAVSIVGTIGFVGLIAPHAARLLIGHNHRRLMPLAALLGAVLLVLADIVGRNLLPPKEIPSGLIVSLLGAPYFLWLMRSSRR
ncbi:Fe3+-hydroxamate ABC transporter permease FhuB [Paenibacillus tyrfis]|uniref:iron ABC transporter permease n=1 Tax=Paenibacillus tyrfis TaxID=1501230 RepID=UPI0024935C9D|nr:iron ABC transporter permease [Paenibacillus tyrfis]GLI10503.1 Fe3+-hydroxamate ABC transporter permease FhuB [Paenibacillus tyrfis]